jgi:protein-S-isoprenylcysteine O-methyltransferase Ste14
MENNNKHKKEYHELINFATQGMGENAQFSIAIAVGVFGILAIFVTINPHNDIKTQDPLLKNALWTKSGWIRTAGIVLSIAYWALILFGIQSYVTADCTRA